MIPAEKIRECKKENLSGLAAGLESDDIVQLVSWLSEKEDDFRYKCFLLLQGRSQQANDVYPHWDVFVEKLNSTNSYQRSIGLMLLAENVRWDDSDKFDPLLDVYLSYCDDEKPVTVRQCIQSLGKIVPYKKNCHSRIIEKLTHIDLMQRKETQRKLLLIDIITVLNAIQKIQPDERIDRFIHMAMTGELLDKKAKQMIALL